MIRGMGPASATAYGYASAWAQHGPDEAVDRIWDAVAYGTRCGRAGVDELLRLPTEHLADYLDAVSRLVEKEGAGSSVEGG